MAGSKSETLVDALRDQPIAAIYASPCQSADQTAEALAHALDLKVKTVDKLQNLDQGLWQGMLVSDVKSKQPKVYRQFQEQPETVCPPQGETLCTAKQRVSAALAKLLKKHKSDRDRGNRRARAAGQRGSPCACGTTNGAICGRARTNRPNGS